MVVQQTIFRCDRGIPKNECVGHRKAGKTERSGVELQRVGPALEVRDGVRPGAFGCFGFKDEGVGSFVSLQDIHARATGKPVVAVAAFQKILSDAAVENIVAETPIKLVRTAAAKEGIIIVLAPQLVVLGPAVQKVVSFGTVKAIFIGSTAQ